VVAGKVAVNVCLRHTVDRPARALADGEVLDLGGRAVRFVATAHVPFWEAGVLFDELERVLFCGDLFTVEGNPPPVSDDDLIAPTLDFERRLKHFTVSAHLPPVLRKLAALQPRMLACMHGPAYNGDAVRTLQKLAAHYDAEFAAS
jgi:flavorubredoxin